MGISSKDGDSRGIKLRVQNKLLLLLLLLLSLLLLIAISRCVTCALWWRSLSSKHSLFMILHWKYEDDFKTTAILSSFPLLIHLPSSHIHPPATLFTRAWLMSNSLKIQWTGSGVPFDYYLWFCYLYITSLFTFAELLFTITIRLQMKKNPFVRFWSWWMLMC